MDSEAYGTHLLLEHTCETLIVLNKQSRVHAPDATNMNRRLDARRDKCYLFKNYI